MKKKKFLLPKKTKKKIDDFFHSLSLTPSFLMIQERAKFWLGKSVTTRLVPLKLHITEHIIDYEQKELYLCGKM